ncbi:MAG: peroxiredoxin, partial [Thermoplasmata archaeon]
KMLKEGDDVKFLDEFFPEFKNKWLILYFYPKDFTSGCTREAISFRDSYSDLKKFGVEIIGVSRDDKEMHKKFKEKYSLPFELFDDTDMILIRKFGVENNNRARRTTFIINPERKIVKVWGRVKVENHVEEIINSLKEVIK